MAFESRDWNPNRPPQIVQARAALRREAQHAAQQRAIAGETHVRAATGDGALCGATDGRTVERTSARLRSRKLRSPCRACWALYRAEQG